MDKIRSGTIRLFGCDYSVEISESAGVMESAIGYCNRDTGRIRLASSTEGCPDRFRSALIHEILEAINAHMELALPHKTICAIEVGLAEIMQNAGQDPFDWVK